MQIKNLMSHPAVTCPVRSTADEAARLMWEFDCGIVPLVDDEGRLAGVITDRDICMAAYTQGRALHSIPVSSAMAGSVVAAHANDSIETVEALMQANRIRRVPVLDGDMHVVGIVSLNDLARAASRAHRSGVDRELVTTMAAVCEPRTVRPLQQARIVERPSLAV